MLRTLLIFALLTNYVVFAQSAASLDSLEREVAALAPDDTLRFDPLNTLFHLTAYDEPERALGYSRLIWALGQDASRPMMVAEGHLRLGIVHENISNFDSAVHHYNQAYNVYLAEGNLRGQGAVLYNSSIVYQREGKYEKAREQLALATAVYAETGDTINQSSVLNVLAQVERESGNFEDGLATALRAVELVTPTGDSAAIIEAEQEIGVNYKMLNNFPEAIKYLERQYSWYARQGDLYFAAATLSILAGAYAGNGELERAITACEQILAKLPPSGMESVELAVRNNLGGFQEEVGNYELAEKEYQQALKLVNAEGDDRRRGMLLTELSEAQMKLGKLPSVIRNAGEAVVLTERLGLRQYEYEARGYLANGLAGVGDYRGSHEQLILRQTLQDSLFQTELAEKLVELTSRYEKDKQDRLISEQQNQLQLLATQARADRWQKTALALGILGLLLVLGGGWFFFRQRYLRQRAEQDRLEDKVRGQQRELSTHALSMARKGQLLDQLSDELSQIKGRNPGDQQRLDGLLRNMSSEERIDQDWDNFRVYFAGVHAGFEDRLRALAKGPSLSHREFRLASLIRMQLNNLEIGSILGLTQDSLYKAKYRLRKKLPEVEQGALDEFLRGV
ncbi:MAG: hypothetical protein AB8H12_25015 [Lewinella sp.]